MELTCFYIIGHLFVRILLPAVVLLCLSGISIYWIMSPDTKKANNIALQANKGWLRIDKVAFKIGNSKQPVFKTRN